jgi:hypothetical protein
MALRAGSGAAPDAMFRRAGCSGADSARWAQAGIEPTIGEMLDDPVIMAVMRRDGVTAGDIAAVIRDVMRRRIAARSGPGPTAEVKT